MKLSNIKYNIANAALRDNEDIPVLDYIDSLPADTPLNLLEVGSGECRFVKKVQKLYPHIHITCIEINPQLAEIATSLGCEVINCNLLEVVHDQQYDIVHCSHVIEHFPYPEITRVLDFLVYSTRIGGATIIRTPLMWENFYHDTDHVRPYPLESILNYYNYNQQQRKGTAQIRLRRLWLRTSPRHTSDLQPWNLLYPLRRICNPVIHKLNRLRQILWNRFRYPSTPPNGYVAIFEPIKH